MSEASRARGPLLTAEQAAELLAVPVSFVRSETRAERLPYVAIGARYKRYDAAASRPGSQRSDAARGGMRLELDVADLSGGVCGNRGWAGSRQ